MRHRNLIVLGIILLLVFSAIIGWFGPRHYFYIQTVALVLTLIAVGIYAEITRRAYKEIQRQTDTAIASHKAYKLSVAADWLLKLENRFDDIELTRARFHVTQFRKQLIQDPGLPLEPAIGDLMEELWDFFETFGVLLKRGMLDKELAYNMFFHWVNGYWRITKKYFEERRKGNDSRWTNFVFLVETLQKAEKHENPHSKDLDWSNTELEEFIEQEFNSNKLALKRFGTTPMNKP